ncbi:hypothetical protein FHR99_003246 [Litorivivens lipolytica]|uniref:Rap1a immunity protein domain-containing protein n=1 Tax=Litorivivens lipolytica TaxID=1524264 RepID=A0A7W4W8U6_9GAMM|nr:hypothetical protein [Litorivivens lipolytica]
MVRTFFLILVLCLPTIGHADVYIDPAFTSGNRYQSLTSAEQMGYVAGVVDGLKLAPTLSADKADMNWFRTCIDDMVATQIKAIVDKFLAENPARWHQGMHTTIYASLVGVCPRS